VKVYHITDAAEAILANGFRVWSGSEAIAAAIIKIIAESATVLATTSSC
jgi:hypothetical protein